VLVFEDDVMFYRTPGLEPGGLIRALSAEPWDVAYFGYCVPPSDPSRSCVSSFAGKTIGGHFYAVRQPFLARMIDYMDASEKRPRNHPLGGPTFRDGAYNNIRLSDPSIRTVIVSPNMALQRSSRTDIGSPARLDLLPLARGPMAMMRGVKNAVRRAFQSDF
jgi:hypothetical protein